MRVSGHPLCCPATSEPGRGLEREVAPAVLVRHPGATLPRLGAGRLRGGDRTGRHRSWRHRRASTGGRSEPWIDGRRGRGGPDLVSCPVRLWSTAVVSRHVRGSRRIRRGLRRGTLRGRGVHLRAWTTCKTPASKSTSCQVSAAASPGRSPRRAMASQSPSSSSPASTSSKAFTSSEASIRRAFALGAAAGSRVSFVTFRCTISRRSACPVRERASGARGGRSCERAPFEPCLRAAPPHALAGARTRT